MKVRPRVSTRDVHRKSVLPNTGILASVLPVISVSGGLRYTDLGIFVASVYRCTGNFSAVF